MNKPGITADITLTCAVTRNVSLFAVTRYNVSCMCTRCKCCYVLLQVFDAVIILASFVVDLVFIKGVPVFVVDESIFILAFLLPWRVIRVVNSKFLSSQDELFLHYCMM